MGDPLTESTMRQCNIGGVLPAADCMRVHCAMSSGRQFQDGVLFLVPAQRHQQHDVECSWRRTVQLLDAVPAARRQCCFAATLPALRGASSCRECLPASHSTCQLTALPLPAGRRKRCSADEVTHISTAAEPTGMPLDLPRDRRGQRVCLLLRRRLGVHPDHVLRSAGPHKRTACASQHNGRELVTTIRGH